ncbi:hypothetical protein PVAP13_1NG361700, partial [Panicum virgatum]
MSNSTYYILPVVEGGNGSGLIMSYEWRPCNYFIAQAQGKAKDGMAVRIRPSNASRLNPVAIPLSTDVMITFHVTAVCVQPMFWHISVGFPLSTSSRPRQHVAVGPSPDMLFHIERHDDGAAKGYKLVCCNGTGPCESLGLYASKGENWLTTSASPFVVVFKK